MLQGKDIILRDFQLSDIPKRIEWETIETEWKLWDSPWEYDSLSKKQRQKDLQNDIVAMKRRAAYVWHENERRKSFQIEVRGEEPRYIGWVASYYLTENYVFTEGKTNRCAVGIDIPDRSARGRGYAYQALSLFIEYLFDQGEKEIYLQTWSGNERMAHIAERMGFEECRRKVGVRTVRGKRYDGLTFRLDIGKYDLFRKGSL